MAIHNPFKRSSKQGKPDSQQQDAGSPQDNQARDGTSAANEQKVMHEANTKAFPDADSTTQHPQAQSLPVYSSSTTAPAPSLSQPQQPPTYRVLPPDPHDPHGQAYGYQYVENEQNFPHPSSVAKDIGKPMEKYDDPKAEALARRASESGREDLSEMVNYFVRQQQLGKKSVDNGIAAWNGV